MRREAILVNREIYCMIRISTYTYTYMYISLIQESDKSQEDLTVFDFWCSPEAEAHNSDAVSLDS